MKTMIAIPCMDTTNIEFTKSILYLEKSENTTPVFLSNTLIYDARNLLSLTAMEYNFDRVMWFDSDMTFKPDTMKRLIAHLDENPDVEMVTGLYVRRHNPITPVIYDRLEPPETGPDGKVIRNDHPFMDYPKNSFFQVEGCGFGCVVTSTNLLQEVWQRYNAAFTPLPWCGEDLSFCKRVTELGHKIWCDSSVVCGHIGTITYDESMIQKGE